MSTGFMDASVEPCVAGGSSAVPLPLAVGVAVASLPLRCIQGATHTHAREKRATANSEMHVGADAGESTGIWTCVKYPKI